MDAVVEECSNEIDTFETEENASRQRTGSFFSSLFFFFFLFFLGRSTNGLKCTLAVIKAGSDSQKMALAKALKAVKENAPQKKNSEDFAKAKTLSAHSKARFASLKKERDEEHASFLLEEPELSNEVDAMIQSIENVFGIRASLLEHWVKLDGVQAEILDKSLRTAVLILKESGTPEQKAKLAEGLKRIPKEIPEDSATAENVMSWRSKLKSASKTDRPNFEAVKKRQQEREERERAQAELNEQRKKEQERENEKKPSMKVLPQVIEEEDEEEEEEEIEGGGVVEDVAFAEEFEPPPDSDTQEQVASVSVTMQKQRFMCPVCMGDFISKEDLLQHLNLGCGNANTVTPSKESGGPQSAIKGGKFDWKNVGKRGSMTFNKSPFNSSSKKDLMIGTPTDVSHNATADNAGNVKIIGAGGSSPRKTPTTAKAIHFDSAEEERLAATPTLKKTNVPGKSPHTTKAIVLEDSKPESATNSPYTRRPAPAVPEGQGFSKEDSLRKLGSLKMLPKDEIVTSHKNSEQKEYETEKEKNSKVTEKISEMVSQSNMLAIGDNTPTSNSKQVADPVVKKEDAPVSKDSVAVPKDAVSKVKDEEQKKKHGVSLSGSFPAVKIATEEVMGIENLKLFLGDALKSKFKSNAARVRVVIQAKSHKRSSVSMVCEVPGAIDMTGQTLYLPMEFQGLPFQVALHAKPTVDEKKAAKKLDTMINSVNFAAVSESMVAISKETQIGALKEGNQKFKLFSLTNPDVEIGELHCVYTAYERDAYHHTARRVLGKRMLPHEKPEINTVESARLLSQKISYVESVESGKAEVPARWKKHEPSDNDMKDLMQA